MQYATKGGEVKRTVGVEACGLCGAGLVVVAQQVQYATKGGPPACSTLWEHNCISLNDMANSSRYENENETIGHVVQAGAV